MEQFFIGFAAGVTFMVAVLAVLMLYTDYTDRVLERSDNDG